MTTIQQGRRICECETPSEHVNPAKKGKCVRCDGLLHAPWVSSSETTADFWEALERGMFPGEPPDWFERFKAGALRREREGRDLYGFAYLNRDNLIEAEDELFDLANYVHFDSLKHRREHGGDDDFDMVLTVAANAARAFEQLHRLRAKRHGAP